jgi:hypothetical protein
MTYLFVLLDNNHACTENLVRKFDIDILGEGVGLELHGV